MPSDHRLIKGVDGQLADIVDRCLATDPNERYANVQSVKDALAARDASRDRRPLLILGLLGPLLMLMVTALFGWWGYKQAVTHSQEMLLKRGKQSNRFAADFVSEAVARCIEGYFRDVEKVANEPEFVETLTQVVQDSEIRDLTDQLRGPESRPELRRKTRTTPATPIVTIAAQTVTRTIKADGYRQLVCDGGRRHPRCCSV